VPDRIDKWAVTSDIIHSNIERSIEVHGRLIRECLDAVAAGADALIGAYQTGHNALFFGNGGSAADAQHLAAEFVGRYLRERGPMPAMALPANSSAVTAIGNDYGYDQVFARQLQAFAVPVTSPSQSVRPATRRALSRRSGAPADWGS
jgi:D-sedoheptulose 7-phosphate isomerase